MALAGFLTPRSGSGFWISSNRTARFTIFRTPGLSRVILISARSKNHWTRSWRVTMCCERPTRGGVEHPVQIVHQELDFEWAEHDLSSRDSIDCAIELEVLLREKILQPFDLTSGPMLRAMVVCLGEQKHILLLVIHHIASDGWSMGLLHSELSELYNAFSQGNHPELADLPIQYADFALWQRDQFSGALAEKHHVYWRKRLADCPSVLSLPTDRPRPALLTYRGDMELFEFSPELNAAIQKYSQSQSVTPFMVLLAAWQALP